MEVFAAEEFQSFCKLNDTVDIAVLYDRCKMEGILVGDCQEIEPVMIGKWTDSITTDG